MIYDVTVASGYIPLQTVDAVGVTGVLGTPVLSPGTCTRWCKFILLGGR